MERSVMQEAAVEKRFVVRSYGKCELAQLYASGITPKAAVKKLNSWIALKPGLLAALAATGMLAKAKYYTPLQVQIIVEALGEP